jgi:uncharacterized protein (DUF342 family)
MPTPQSPLDRFVGVAVSADRMSALLVLAARPAALGLADPVPPTGTIVERVLALAEARHVTAPIDRGAVTHAIDGWRVRGEKREVVIARGRPPVAGADAQITLRRPKHAEPTGVLAPDRVGKRNQGRVLNVEKGAVLATVAPPTAGTPGRAVTGEVVPAEPGRPTELEAGPLVGREEEDGTITFRALETAILVELSTKRIEVARSIEIPGTVDHETGNLDVWGSVTIRGSVVDGFSVRARGDVVIAGSAESARVEAGGSVTVGGGILGKSGATEVRCRGACSARFVENAVIDAGGDVTVGDFVLQSQISAGGTVEVKGRGTILASRITAGRAVIAASVGSDARLPVELAVGGRPQEWQRIARMERDMRFLRRDALAVAAPFAMGSRAPSPRVVTMGPQAVPNPRAHSSRESQRAALEDRRRRRRCAAVLGEALLRRRHRALLDALMADGGPRVLIRRELHPRTRVRLGPYLFEVTSVLRAGTLRIDDAQNAAVWLPDKDR